MKRILVDIAKYSYEISDVIYRFASKSVLKQMTCSLVFLVVLFHEFDLYPFHDDFEDGVCFLKQQVDMIIHETICIQFKMA